MSLRGEIKSQETVLKFVTDKIKDFQNWADWINAEGSGYIISSANFAMLQARLESLDSYGIMSSEEAQRLSLSFQGSAAAADSEGKAYKLNDSKALELAIQRLKEIELVERVKLDTLKQQNEDNKIHIETRKKIDEQKKKELSELTENLFSNNKVNYTVIGILLFFLFKK